MVLRAVVRLAVALFAVVLRAAGLRVVRLTVRAVVRLVPVLLVVRGMYDLLVISAANPVAALWVLTSAGPIPRGGRTGATSLPPLQLHRLLHMCAQRACTEVRTLVPRDARSAAVSRVSGVARTAAIAHILSP